MNTQKNSSSFAIELGQYLLIAPNSLLCKVVEHFDKRTSNETPRESGEIQKSHVGKTLLFGLVLESYNVTKKQIAEDTQSKLFVKSELRKCN